jgi:hypothetical protein
VTKLPEPAAPNRSWKTDSLPNPQRNSKSPQRNSKSPQRPAGLLVFFLVVSSMEGGQPMKFPKPPVVDLAIFRSSRAPTLRPATPRFLPSAAKIIGGPIPVDWLATAAKQGQAALLAGLMVWCVRNWPKHRAAKHIALSSDAFKVWGVTRPGRALSRLEASGLIKVIGHTQGHAAVIELLVPEWSSPDRFVLGPIEIAWVVRAAKLGVTALLTGLAVWGCYRQRRHRRDDERMAVPNVALVDWSISRYVKRRSLHKLADAGLIKVERCGLYSPRVTILSPYAKDKNKGEGAAEGDVMVGVSHGKLDRFKSTRHGVAIAERPAMTGVDSAAIVGNVVQFAAPSSAARHLPPPQTTHGD